MTPPTGAERDVRALEREYDEAWTAGDPARLMKCFAPDATIITPYGDAWNGLPEIEQGLRDVMAQPSRETHTSTIHAVHFVTADVALVDGSAVLDADSAGATDEDQSLPHSFTDVVVKHAGAWRIAHVRAYAFIG